MSRKRRTYLIRRIGPFDAYIHAFSVLAEDHYVHLRFFKSAGSLLANEVQGIAGKADARPDARVQAKALAHGDDGTVIGIAFAAQFRFEFGVGFFFRLRSNRTEKSEL